MCHVVCVMYVCVMYVCVMYVSVMYVQMSCQEHMRLCHVCMCMYVQMSCYSQNTNSEAQKAKAHQCLLWHIS